MDEYFKNRKTQLLLLVLVVSLCFASKSLHRISENLEDWPQFPHKTRQSIHCFDRRGGTTACAAKVLTKLYFLASYYDESATAIAKPWNWPPLVSSVWDFFETLYFERPKAEAFSKAIGVFIGDFVGGHVGKSILQAKNPKLGFVSGSLLGGAVGGEIGIMAYDVWHGFGLLCDHILHVLRGNGD